MPRGDFVGTERVAAAAGVSPEVVPAFFERQPGVMEDAAAAERILAAGRELGYQPVDPSWRVRLYPQQGDFCMVLDAEVGSGFTNEYFSRMVNGVMDRLGQMGLTLTFDRYDPTEDYAANPSRLPASVRAGSTASRFLIAGRPNLSFTRWLTRLGFPVVHLSRAVEMPGVHSVVPDFAHAARWAVCYLASLGHRHVALAMAPHFLPGGWNTEELLRGARDAAEVARLTPRDLPVLTAPGDPRGTLAWSQVIFDKFLRLNPRPTALFCFDDFTAVPLMSTAQRAGWVIPRDLSLMGCNDVTTSLTSHPALTTMHLPLDELGRLGIEKLVAMSEPGQSLLSQPPGITTLDVHLVERASTTAPAPPPPPVPPLPPPAVQTRKSAKAPKAGAARNRS